LYIAYDNSACFLVSLLFRFFPEPNRGSFTLAIHGQCFKLSYSTVALVPIMSTADVWYNVVLTAVLNREIQSTGAKC